MDKPDELSKHLGPKRSGKDAYLVHERQLLDRDNADFENEVVAKDVQLEGIHVSTWEKLKHSS